MCCSACWASSLFYSALLVADLYLLLKYIRLGPDAHEPSRGPARQRRSDAMSYETLRLIWWALLGILLIGFAVMDGFDLGTAALLPFVGAQRHRAAHRHQQRSAPVWEGNQVWFILGGGAIFAAWPALYAASFSGFYLAMFLVLATLILRPVGFKFRSKVDATALARAGGTGRCSSGGIVPSLVFGVAFGNLFLGVPFSFDGDLRIHSDITLWSLLSPFALLCGLVSLAMIVMHGAAWLNLKTAMRSRRGRAWRCLRRARLCCFCLSPRTLAAGPRRLPRRPRHRSQRAVQSHGKRRPYREPWLAGNFQSCAAALAHSRRRGRRDASGLGFARQPLKSFLFSALAIVLHHRHRWRGAVSLPAAVVRQAGRQPDGVGRLVEQADPGDHAGRGGDFPAVHHRLHRLGLPRDARPGDGANGSTATTPIEDTMWYFSWVLGLGFAVTLAVLNAMWLESRHSR